MATGVFAEGERGKELPIRGPRTLVRQGTAVADEDVEQERSQVATYHQCTCTGTWTHWIGLGDARLIMHPQLFRSSSAALPLARLLHMFPKPTTHGMQDHSPTDVQRGPV